MAFKERGKPENPKKNPRNKEENQQQIQPTYVVDADICRRRDSTAVTTAPPLLPTLTHARKYHFHNIEIDGFSTWQG